MTEEHLRVSELDFENTENPVHADGCEECGKRLSIFRFPRDFVQTSQDTMFSKTNKLLSKSMNVTCSMPPPDFTTF